MVDNTWLLFETENFDPACEEVVIVCIVEIKVLGLFRVIYPERPRNGQADQRPILQVKSGGTPNEVNTISANRSTLRL
ncbi:hypothetical protein M514_03161 [Trichuris suis]|uniref:Uncharacterized protein n=1 Tax=Trichuris suis TaxID=68888 RepID=A0A085MFP1_9BILA|nr:hypothetical protein M513_03161 [Trichuris suis]KFD65988.1 hypothetical protein M514_03161 [Trichuris suis]